MSSSKDKKSRSLFIPSATKKEDNYRSESRFSSSKKDSRPWDSAGSSRKTVDLSGEEQLARVNAIADIENPGFAPQNLNFQSKRLFDKEKDKIGEKKDSVSKGSSSKLLTGPIEDLISPDLLPGTEEERLERQAKSITALRKELLRKRPDLSAG